MRNFNELSNEDQAAVTNMFELHQPTDQVVVDEFNRPFIQTTIQFVDREVICFVNAGSVRNPF